MRKMVNIWKLIATLAIILIVYFVLSGSLAKDRKAVEEQKMVAEQNLQNEMARNDELTQELEYSTSDAYIENVARTQFDYMFPNEIQIIFDNPEALYGEGNVPSR
ncbi:MAG: septum formation initiator family protein [Clostridia bacterium]|nr:septum formation initiator family protein [Clostridia bacterium]